LYLGPAGATIFGAERARSAAGATACGSTAAGAWDGKVVAAADEVGGLVVVAAGCGGNVATGAAAAASGTGFAGAPSAGATDSSGLGFSKPTVCLTRSTNVGSGSTTGGGGGGGAGAGSTTFSPDHSRKLWQDAQNVSPSGFWLPHFLQTITARFGPSEMLTGHLRPNEEAPTPTFFRALLV